eukprot:CAMPEP_0172889570 /NCGR_PEP_ID=MMETSP1075-20121228/139194_1 /TAXON_ID=2916 /ORGANISM="Ceratium fusus, Strain PA161109" /LENGTH=78 /DNA_ID=CAMNT_0013743661 /DNA_START=52 /DNA_END=288 /DNA_ORIENTATION=+
METRAVQYFVVAYLIHGGGNGTGGFALLPGSTLALLAEVLAVGRGSFPDDDFPSERQQRMLRQRSMPATGVVAANQVS